MAQFRNSKLTMLLSQAISGNSCTAMVGTLSPALCSRDETLSTLRFAAAVRGIRLEATKSAQIQSLDERATLEQEIQELRGQLQSYRAEAEVKAARELLTSQALCKRLQQESDESRQAAMKASEEHIQALQRLSNLQEMQQMSSAPAGGFFVGDSFNGKRAKVLVQDANLLLRSCKQSASMTFGIVELPSSRASTGTFAMDIFVQLCLVDYQARPGSPPRVLHVWTVEEFDALAEQMKREATGTAHFLEQFRCLEQYTFLDPLENSNSHSSSSSSTPPSVPSSPPSVPSSPRSVSSISTATSFTAPSSSSSRAPAPSKLAVRRPTEKLVHGKASKVESLQSKLTELEHGQAEEGKIWMNSLLRDLRKSNTLLTEEFDALMRAIRALNEGDAVLLVPECQ